MKIVLVSSEFPVNKDDSTGGIGTYLLDITEGLTNLGHQVFVISKWQDRKADYKKIKVIYVEWGKRFINLARKIVPFSFYQRVLNFLEYPIFFSFGVFLKLKELEKKETIDIIEGNDFGGELFFYLSLKKKRPPVVLKLHTPSFIIRKFNDEPYNLFYRIMKFLEVFCLKKADSLYSPTKSLAKIIEKEIRKPVKTVIPHPFRSPYYFSNIKRKDNLVLYVGKLQPKKGVFLLVETIPYVLEKLPKTLFYFVGPDTLQNGVSVRRLLKEKLENLKVLKNVRLIDQLGRRSLYRLYRQATVLVIPSFWENFGLVSLEAMLYNCPVIASNSGGLKEIITDGKDGLLFNINSKQEIIKAIDYMLENEKFRSEITTYAGINLRKKYNLNRIARLTSNYYKRVIINRV